MSKLLQRVRKFGAQTDVESVYQDLQSMSSQFDVDYTRETVRDMHEMYSRVTELLNRLPKSVENKIAARIKSVRDYKTTVYEYISDFAYPRGANPTIDLKFELDFPRIVKLSKVVLGDLLDAVREQVERLRSRAIEEDTAEKENRQVREAIEKAVKALRKISDVRPSLTVHVEGIVQQVEALK